MSNFVLRKCSKCNSGSIIKVYTNIEAYWCEDCGTLYYKNYFSTGKMVRKIPHRIKEDGESQTTWEEI